MPNQVERLTTSLAGRYAISRELGHGGMATVYLAEDLRHGRQVAIKVLRPELGAFLGADRFAREIRIAASLSHPHIVQLYDSGSADGLLFYVMPYVRGESLRQKLEREGRLGIDEAVTIARQVATALAHAHAHDLVHRDVKPENILLFDGLAMVTDFGIAVGSGPSTAERLTEIGLTVGTPAYMSPEQALGERDLDARSDIYSLACVLYEMLTGQAPQSGGTPRSVLAQRIAGPAPRLRRDRPEAPPAIERAVARALAADPAERFPTALAFAEALTPSAATAPVVSASPSVAVLPFSNLCPDPESGFFADGITEDVTAQLAKIRSLKVSSHRSVVALQQRNESSRQIAAQLDVATLLEGSVRRAGNRVRIVARLIEVETDRQLWADTYDRDLTDIFAIQTDVALKIATALERELSPEEQRRIRQQPTNDVEAYQSYLLARHCMAQWTQAGLDQALRHLEKAVARDPDYARAYATIANVYVDIGLGVAGSLPADEAFRRGKAAALRALEIDPNLPEGYAVLGYLTYGADFDWDRAESLLKQAIELDPNSGDAYDFYGLLLAAQERYDEAIAMQRRAYEIDPLGHRFDIATSFLRAGRYDEALATVRRVLEVEPHVPLGHATLGWAHVLGGRPDQGIAALEKAVSLAPDNTMYRSQLGQALAMAGRRDDARDVLRELEQLSGRRYVSPYHMAYVLTGLGEHEGAMDWLERAYQERAGAIFGIKGSFLFRALRPHPRFQALLRKMNLA